MLVLARNPGQEIVIGNDIRLTILESRHGRVSIGISAPDSVTIRRAELLNRQCESVLPEPSFSSAAFLKTS